MTNTVVLGVMNSPGAMLDCAPAAILPVARNRKAARDVTFKEILCEEDESIAIIMPRILLGLGLDKSVL
jgi:hypothetical protein